MTRNFGKVGNNAPAIRLKYKPHINNAGGLFTPIARERLLGLEGQTGRGRTKSDFWYHVRTSVENGLIDLDLFIETADDKDVNMVLNRVTLDPFVKSLLSIWNTKPDKMKAEIAQLFILAGFEYLLHWSPHPDPLKKCIEDAEEFSDHLVELLGGEGRFNFGKLRG
jgi:hypothetical protein